MTADAPAARRRLPWLTALSVAALVAATGAGIWGIAAAWRAAVDQAARTFSLEAATRTHRLESLLSATRADLAFLSGSSTLWNLEEALASPDPSEARWRRLAAEGALILFLRGHPEVQHVVAVSDLGGVLVAVGRRGGVPVLWRPASLETSQEFQRSPLTTVAPVTTAARTGHARVGLQAALDPSSLLEAVSAGEGADRFSCSLRDASGATLARDEAVQEKPGRRKPGDLLFAESPLRAEGWGAPSPWLMACAQQQSPSLTLIAPIVARYRLALGLNLAMMLLALMLGFLAIQQTRRRERLEAAAREESRVREVERQLFHSERLGTVGRLAAGMAHEINNPLEGISNYLSLAEDSLRRGDPGSARDHLGGVRHGLERAASVVRQVLAHSDPARTPKEALDLHECLIRSVEFVRSRKEFNRIAFDVALDRAPAVVSGNQVLLGQIFLNLLLNACEAQPGGGAVMVRTRTEGRDLVVEIADQGPGVGPDDAVRVFEPFYSTKGSTGLGLSICHAIARQHDGELSVESRREGGALFRLRLPAAPAASASLAQEPVHD